MKVYEVWVARTTVDGWGAPDERVAVVSSKDKAERKVAEYRAEHEVNEWWMEYGRTPDHQHIRMRIEAVEVE